MARYTVQSPDGKTITLEGPDGASQADVIAQAQALYAQHPASAQPAPAQAKPSLLQNFTGVMANFNRGTGIGDEIAGGLTGIANAVTGKDPIHHLSDIPAILSRGMQQQRAIEDGYGAAHPNVAALAQGTGTAAITALPGARGVTAALEAAPAGANLATKALVTGGNIVRGGTAAAIPGAAFGLVDRGNIPQRVQAADTGAATGFAMGGTLSGLAGRLAPPKPKLAAAPTLDSLKAQKTAAYKAVDDMGIVYKPEAIDSLVQGVTDDLQAAGMDSGLHPKATALAARVQKLLGQPLTLPKVDQLRQLAGEVAGDPSKGERRLGKTAVQSIDDFVNSAGPDQVFNGNAPGAAALIARARDLNTRAAKVETVQNVVDRAKLQAGSTGSGGNVDNAIRQKLRRVLETQRNLSPEETDALKTAVVGDKGQNALRLAGKLSPSGNGLMAAMNLGSAAALGPLGAAPGAVGMVSKLAADRITQDKVAKLVDLMARGGADAHSAALTLAQMAQTDPEVLNTYNAMASRLSQGVSATAARSSGQAAQ